MRENKDKEINKQQVIPYRECKLTKVLFEYFIEENNLVMVIEILSFCYNFYSLEINTGVKKKKKNSLYIQIHIYLMNFFFFILFI